MSRRLSFTLSFYVVGLVGAAISACGRTSLEPDQRAGAAGATGGSSAMSTGGASSTNAGGAPLSNLPRFDCKAVASQQFDDATMQSYRVPAEVAAKVESTLSLMSPAQKASQLLGVDGAERDHRDTQRSIDIEVAGVGTIRGYRYRDGSRGVNLQFGQDNRLDHNDNFATAFPAVSIRAASWDLDLERRVGIAIGDETAASLNNMNQTPAVNIVRHPYWARTQDSYGEDMYAIGRMGAAFTVGLQEYVAGCARHWGAYTIDKQRAEQDALIDEQTLREIYGRPLEMVAQDGAVGCVMSAYNSVNGVRASQNEHLLRRILKGPLSGGGFGFEGMVVTEWWGMPGDWKEPDAATAQALTHEALQAGTDVELPWTLHYSQVTLANADQKLVEEAARRVLTQKFRFNTALDTDDWGKKAPSSTLKEDGSIVAHPAHEELAEEVARKSAVLLQNGLIEGAPVLPLTGAAKIAVMGREQAWFLAASTVPKSCEAVYLGPGHPTMPRDCIFDFATDPALGDRGVNLVNADSERSVGPFDGIQQVAGADRIVTSGSSPEIALNADAIVVVVGYTPGDEGEEWTISDGGDRDSLDLPPGHAELVQQLLDLDKPTVVIIESGSIVNLPWLNHPNKNQATIWAGYPGQRGGLALGKLIFGQANFSGKLPMVWPLEDQLPAFKDTEFTTTLGYFFGYRELDRRQYVQGEAVSRVFPFGHGLSYSNFEYGNLVLPCPSASKEAIVQVKVDITNVSNVDGDEVAMLFVKPPPKSAGVTGERPHKELKSFARVSVPAGKTVTAELPLRIRDLRRWEGGPEGRWVIDSGDYTILVGKNAADAETTGHRGVVRVDED